MNLSHPAIQSKIFELIKTIDFDVALGTDGFNLRIELLRAISAPNHFRAHIWRSEFYRIQSTFPQNYETHDPADPPSDELIFIDYSTQLGGDYSDFQADDETVALQMVLDDCQRFLKRIMGE
jgi:hypothetical protein